MPHLVLLRHGESEFNARGVYAGHEDTPLTELGRQQAREAGKLLHGMAFDAVYTSDLSRAIETAELALATGNHENIILNKLFDLRERSYGDWTGLPYRSQHTDETPFFEAPPNGESYEMLFGRVKQVFDDTFMRHFQNGDNIFIVSHGGTKRVLHVLMGLMALEDCPTHYIENAAPLFFTYQICPEQGLRFFALED